MSDQSPNLIEAQAAPLSHLQKRRQRRLGVDTRIIAVVATVAVVAIAIYFLAPSAPAPRDAIEPSFASPTQSASDPATAETGLAPFAASQQQIARQRAQASLTRFVEGQLRLENEMQVAAWGAEELSTAQDRAKSGDLAFAAEQFDTALIEYAAAADLIEEVLALGEQLFTQHTADALAAIDQLQVEPARGALAAAKTIKPEAPQVAQLSARVATLPEVIGLLRTAKNHELAERYNDARATYLKAQQLDPDLPQTPDLLANVDRQIHASAIAASISAGFAALDANRFQQARSSFQEALRLDPNNPVALGGLEQVAQDNDLSVIAAHRRSAEQALADEDWQTAVGSYGDILQLDANIQFAVNGQREAKAHDRAERLLKTIASAPEKLSAQALFLDAQALVQSADALEHRGPRLNALLSEAKRLLELYRYPVEVVLRSDNATDIVMSNLGRLGFFDEKIVSLRPGQYTIRGSQHGCRDLYLSIEVLPGIEPLDLSCPEPLERK